MTPTDPADEAVAREYEATAHRLVAIPLERDRRMAIARALRDAHAAGLQAGRKEEREACLDIIDKCDRVGMCCVPIARAIRARTGAEEEK